MAFFIALLGLLFIGCIPELLFGSGLLVAFASFWALRREFFISRHGLVVPGTVIAIDVRQSKARGHATVYDAVVSFQMLEHADPLTFLVNTGSFRVYHVNQPVRVIYLPEDRGSARIDGRRRWIVPCLGIGFGLGFAALTVILSLQMISIQR